MIAMLIVFVVLLASESAEANTVSIVFRGVLVKNVGSKFDIWKTKWS